MNLLLINQSVGTAHLWFQHNEAPSESQMGFSSYVQDLEKKETTFHSTDHQLSTDAGNSNSVKTQLLMVSLMQFDWSSFQKEKHSKLRKLNSLIRYPKIKSHGFSTCSLLNLHSRAPILRQHPNSQYVFLEWLTIWVCLKMQSNSWFAHDFPIEFPMWGICPSQGRPMYLILILLSILISVLQIKVLHYLSHKLGLPR